jgi:hypothetical protein
MALKRMLRTTYVFDAERRAFLESGCALIIATAGPDGEPTASRGWGLTFLDAPDELRLLLDAEDGVTVERAAAGAPIAVTAASVPTLHSMQLKGRSLGVAEATAADEARAARYCDALFTEIHVTDQTPLALLERLTPIGYVACTIAVDDVYDQTPGPSAGARVTPTQ